MNLRKALQNAATGAKIGAAVGGAGIVVITTNERNPKTVEYAVFGAAWGATIGAILGGLGSVAASYCHCG